MSNIQLNDSFLVFSFKENNFLEVNDFLVLNPEIALIFNIDFFIFVIGEKKIIYKYESIFEYENNYYFLVNKLNKIYLIEDAGNNVLYVEYSFFKFLNVCLIEVDAFVFIKNLITNVLLNKFLIKLIVLIYLTFFSCNVVINDETSDLNKRYIIDYLIYNTVNKLIYENLNKGD